MSLDLLGAVGERKQQVGSVQQLHVHIQVELHAAEMTKHTPILLIQ